MATVSSGEAGTEPLKGAVAEIEEAVQVSPDYTAAYLSLAEAALAAGDKDKTRRALQRALKVKNPEDPGEHEENLADARRMLAELAGSR